MKKTNYIASLSHAFMALAVVGALTSCADDAGLFDKFQGGNGDELSISPVVSEPTLVTRATTPSDATLNEELLNTLDVFVEAVDNPGSFLKQYHLEAPTDQIGHEVKSLLAENWRAEGLELGKNYNIYVATNNPKTKTDVASVEALKALTYDEVSAGVATVNDANNIADRSGNIYKQYVSANPLNGQTTEKEFMMDGIIKNWTPDATTRDQVFGTTSNVLTLNRAAAKIVLNAKFDKNFLKSLTHTMTVEGEDTTWTEKPAAEQVTITGSPAWRFYNFAFGAPVFAPETQGDGIAVHSSDRQLFGAFKNTDNEFQIITYSYPNKWEDASGAPTFVVSIGYTQDGKTSYNYYRIPIVPKTTTTFERNHIYVINATIATRGSKLHEDVDEIEDVHYYVLPWNDESNSAAIHNEVEAIQHLYLKVDPKVYTLRGDGEQSLIINYLKASGTQVKWQLYTFNTSTQAKGTNVEPTNGNAVWGWYYDDDGTMKTSYTGMTHIGVDIQQSGEGTSGTKGTVTVTSTALPNRAIKYMLLRIYLADSPTLYEDVIIRHFPTDNIQNIKSLWSSRTSSGWWKYSNGTGNNATGYKNDQQAGNTSTESNLFRAKYYNSTSRTIYGFRSNDYGSGGSWSDIGLDNICKYVIQISSTSDLYVLGRPLLNSYKQSNDHVVSPAFMIASQLGATSNKQPNTGYNNNIATYARAAANHCDTYKEVDSDGTEWTEWRLPTREEVGVILRYQHANYDTMDPVLTGQYYWTLEGAAVATGVLSQNNNGTYNWANNWSTRYSDSSYDYPGKTGDQVTSRNCYIRCIRDMSAKEIEDLNDFTTIVDRYREGNN